MMARSMRSRPLVAFFVLAFVVTWAVCGFCCSGLPTFGFPLAQTFSRPKDGGT